MIERPVLDDMLFILEPLAPALDTPKKFAALP
jgi:hypothetical protein